MYIDAITIPSHNSKENKSVSKQVIRGFFLENMVIVIQFLIRR